MESSTYYTVQETAVLLGRYQWVEQRLFELLGSWAGAMESPEASYLVGTQSFNHEFHADLLRKRLPELRNQPKTLVVAPCQEAVEALAIDRWAEVSDTKKLAFIYRVIVPQISGAYSSHMARTAEVADGPTRRCLQLCLNDYQQDWPNGEYFLHAHVKSSDAVVEASETTQQWETSLPPGLGLL